MSQLDQLGIAGDGVQDDSAGIQRLLDTRAPDVYLPPPRKYYCVGRTLRIHSGQTLRLDRTTTVRLADGANCILLQNADPAGGDRDIQIVGGIWDGNNLNQRDHQKPGPTKWWDVKQYDPELYFGVLIRLLHVRNLRLAGLTLKDPESFGLQLGRLEHFLIEDITLDYNRKRGNMDGVHVHGPARFGRIANVHGAGNDDHVALNADDGTLCEMSRGPISDVVVDGVFAEDGYTAVRLLSCGSPVSRIRVSNIFGTYRYNVVSFTQHKVHPGETSTFEDVAIDGIFCAKRDPAVPQPGDLWACGAEAQIVFRAGTRTRNVSIRGLHRTEEYQRPPDTIVVEAGACVEHLAVSDATFTNRSPRPLHLVANHGEIGTLALTDARYCAEGGAPRGGVLSNQGRIGVCQQSGVTADNGAVQAEYPA